MHRQLLLNIFCNHTIEISGTQVLITIVSHLYFAENMLKLENFVSTNTSILVRNGKTREEKKFKICSDCCLGLRLVSKHLTYFKIILENKNKESVLICLARPALPSPAPPQLKLYCHGHGMRRRQSWAENELIVMETSIC